MRSAPHLLLLLAAAQLVAPRGASGQQGKLPWRAGDPPPSVIGLRLGASRATIDSVLGKPENVQTISPGDLVLSYPTRGIALVYSQQDSLLVVYLRSPGAGDIGGVRVGESRDSVVARWGKPSGTDGSLDAYEVGSWAIVLQFDASRSRVALLGIGRGSERSTEAGPYDSTANARQEVDDALLASHRDHKLVLLDFGANWCLDCQVLDRLFKDSTVAGFLSANFHVVHIDVGDFDRNLDISKSYGSPIDKGVPAVVVLSPAGDIIASTKNGSLENARSATPQKILSFLHSWVAAAHR